MAIRNELHGREELNGIEERIIASFERLSNENYRLSRALQALFALVEALSKTLLTCLPEPPADAKPQAIALARDRYHRLIKSAGLEYRARRARRWRIFSAMILSDDDRPIRIRPRRPRVARHEAGTWAGAYRLLMHYARAGREVGRVAGDAARTSIRLRAHSQRCAVRVTYLNNWTRGQWRAHGHYLARESAVDSKARAGFNHDRDRIDIARELGQWQSSGDQRLWKVILSPEFGDRIDLQRLTSDVIRQMERDLKTELEWIAAAHHNTEHPHVHIAIRGITNAGQPLHFKREYVKHGIRCIAEEMCTRQLGYRTSRDAAEAERREISETRFTSLDRALLMESDKTAQEPAPRYFTVVTKPAQIGQSDPERIHPANVVSRLAVLQRMGLAESVGSNTWRVRQDLEEVLRGMQQAVDRQRILAAHGVPISDQRLPIQMLDMRKLTAVEGRILVHGEDEQSGRRYGSGANSRSSSIQSVLHVRLRRIHVRQPEQLARSPVSLPWIRPACPF
jgi:hypothetical protein